MGQPGGYGAPPGQPAAAYPEEIKLAGILMLIAGIIGSLQFLAIVVSTLGCALLALTPLYAGTVAVMEIVAGARAVTGNPYRKKFWWFGLPIMAICAVLGMDIWSCVVGIIVLVITNKPHVKAWME